jgi:hypothetical protein
MEVTDALLQGVSPVHVLKMESAVITEAVYGVQIALIGLIQDVVLQSMMGIVLLVSNASFQKIHVLRSFMNIQKKSAYVMQSPKHLNKILYSKDLYMIVLFIRVIAIVHIGDV